MRDFQLLGMLTLSTILLGACSTTPTVSSSQLRQKLTDSRVVVSSVAGSVLGSGGNAGNMQQLQNNMQISQQFSQQLYQSLPQTYKVGSGHGADLALAKKVSDYFNPENVSSTEKSQEIHISISGSLWELGYISMLTSQDYALNYGMHFLIKEKQGDKFKVLAVMHCAGSAKEKMELDAWKANAYAKVNEAATTIVDKCFNDFIAFSGLPLSTKMASANLKY
ncbi:hypothetical protein LG202_00500 [Methylobacillus methanolivorans]